MQQVSRLLPKLLKSKSAYQRHRADEVVPPSERYFQSASQNFVLIVAAGAVASLVCGVSTCITQKGCADKGLCTKHDDLSFCAFSNKITLATDVVYASNATAASLAYNLRGTCEPGDRQQAGGHCQPFYPYPNALNEEIMNGAESLPHRRACGAWIDAGGVSLFDTTYRSFEDQSEWVRALEHTENTTTSSPRMATNPMGKFRAACDRTALAGSPSLRTAAVLAYEFLTETPGATSSSSSSPVTQAEAVQFSGRLAAHGCASPVTIDMFLATNGRFAMEVLDGVTFYEGVLSQSLFLVGASESDRNEAELANERVNGLVESLSTPALNMSFLNLLLVDEDVGEDDVVFAYAYTNILDSIVYLAADPGVFDLRAYLRGVAAFCAATVRSQIDVVGQVLSAEMSRLQESMPKATAIGRTRSTAAKGSVEAEVTNETARAASSVTFAQLGLSSTSDPQTDCFAMTRRIFAEEMDSLRFDATLTDPLYARLESMVYAVRLGVAEAVLSEPIRSLLHEPARVAFDVMFAGFRIAGAPRGSWAAVSRPLPLADLRHDDSVFVMALKQAKAIFDDRVHTVLSVEDPCEHTPFFPATEANAYAIPPMRCTYMLLGMLKRPWLDQLYDDESALSRALLVVAHELGHMTLNSPLKSELDTFLGAYQPSTRVEALADVVAVIGINKTGLVKDASRISAHFCQLFCARVAVFPTVSSTHPAPNERCDFLVQTLEGHMPVM